MLRGKWLLGLCNNLNYKLPQSVFGVNRPYYANFSHVVMHNLNYLLARDKIKSILNMFLRKGIKRIILI